jgi:hypothetical protein
MIDDRTSAGPRAWHPTYRIDHASPSGKKPVTVASLYILNTAKLVTQSVRSKE